MSKRLMVVVFFLSLPLVTRAADIHESVRAGNIIEIERLLKQRPSRVDLIEKDGVFTPLQLAALRGDRPVIQALLAVKADPKNLAESMRYSVWRGEMENVQLFLSHGAVVPIDLLDSVMNNLKVDDKIILNVDLQTTLIEPTPEAIKTRLELARLALEHGAGVNHPAALSRETPIFYSFHWGIDMVKLLLEAQADVRVRDIEQRATLLHYAALTANDPAIFKLLADKGLSLDLRDRIERTPLAWAARRGNVVAARALIDLGADVQVKDVAGWTPLHVAASRGEVKIMEMLLAKGAELNARTNCGWTPVYAAARYNNIEAVKLLIAKGADLNIPDVEGHPALAAARDQWSEQVTRTLEAAGAKDVARLCDGPVCEFEREMRNRRKYFFDQPPQKKCVLIDHDTGLFTIDILPDDFGLIVGDLETGSALGSYKYAFDVDGRLVSYRNVKPARPLFILLDEKNELAVSIHFRMEPKGAEGALGHLNRLSYGSGGLGEIIMAAVKRNSGLSGMLRGFQIE